MNNILSGEEIKKLLAEHYNRCEERLLPDCPLDRNYYNVSNVSTWPSYEQDKQLIDSVIDKLLKEGWKKPEDVRGKVAPEDSSEWKCNWIECVGGIGLAGSGYCFKWGEWNNPECPRFELATKDNRTETPEENERNFKLRIVRANKQPATPPPDKVEALAKELYDWEGRYGGHDVLWKGVADKDRSIYLEEALFIISEHSLFSKVDIDDETRKEILGLLNLSVVTYRVASYWGAEDYKCVEILIEKEVFGRLEDYLGEINGRIGKQYEGK